MPEQPAFHSALSGAPDGSVATWVTADDGVRIRLVVWPGGTAGTVLLLNGRTEYVEKYGEVIGALVSRGWSVATFDWRGQGLSDRLLSDPSIGYVQDFSDFQRDLTAALNTQQVRGLPGPRIALCHSMGGCIGLSALLSGLDVSAAIFSAPMWGLPLPRPVLRLAHTLTRFGYGHLRMPGTGRTPYTQRPGQTKNVLTSDMDQFARMTAQVSAVPALGLAGASAGWLSAAHFEMARLQAAPAPEVPHMVLLGSDDEVIDRNIVAKMAQRRGSLVLLNGARHEPLFETPTIRAQLWDAVDRFLAQV